MHGRVKKSVFYLRLGTENFRKSMAFQCRSVAQAGSAPDLGSGGRRFESYRSDHFFIGRQVFDEKMMQQSGKAKA